MVNIEEVYIGVDVSKSKLDIHIYPIGRFLTIQNTKKEIDKFAKELTKYKVAQIACESTGGYQNLLVQSLRERQYSTWVVDPRRIKGFIVANGCRSKTDKIDAQKIAEFAAKTPKDYDSYCKTDNENQLLALVNRKDDLTKFLAAEKTRLKHPSHSLSLTSIKKIIKVLEAEIKKIDKQIEDIIQQDNTLNSKSKILESIPGIGKASAAVLISFVPELGALNKSQISALVGVCPYDNQSGKYNGKKFIRGGRAAPRKQLYMCALTTIKYNLVFKEFYDRLREKNKPFKVAIVAVMHKLIMLSNSLLKREELCKV